MATDARVEELLLDWEERRENGQDLAAAELCKDCPELVGEVEKGIEALKAAAWMAPGSAKQDTGTRQDTSPTPDDKASAKPRPAGWGQAIRAAGRYIKEVFTRKGKPSVRPEGGKPSVPDLPAVCPLGSEPVPSHQVINRLGQGGFGEVWKATGPGGFEVALKMVKLSEKSAKAELRALEVIKGIRHANLVAMSGSWQVRGWLVIAMELADKTLADRLQEALAVGQPGIPERELYEYMEEAAKGLDFLNQPHPKLQGEDSRGIQHRDVKPQNLLLVGGSVKVADFGLARVLKNEVTSHTGHMTSSYAAPEFFSDQTSIRSDQYSLAVTYCQLRGGRLPFVGNAAQVMRGHLERNPDLTMLPEGERSAVARALAKDPQQRWTSCLAFVRAIRTGDRKTRRR